METTFFSLLMNGTVDAGNVEDELVAIVYTTRDDSSQQLTTSCRFLSLHSLPRADASGLLQCLGGILKCFSVGNILDKGSVLSVEGKPVLVGIGTDGAAVNLGKKTGLRGQVQRALPWVFWSWCYAHHFELAWRDSFCSFFLYFLICRR